MGIGRRAFLEIFGAGIAALTLNPTSAIALVGEHYINRRLGVAFRKPPGWTFADMAEMEDVKAGQILDLEDPALAREVVNSMELPILCLTKDKFSAESKCFTPGINVYLDRGNPREEGEVRDSLVKLLRNDLESMCDVLRNFKITHEPTLVRVSDCEGVEATATWVFEHVNLDEPAPIRLRTLVIDQGAAVYTIRMYDAPLLGPEMTFDYDAFVRSIKLV
jgi:hypothetical protein